jgi:phosphate butyryltransferase
MKYATHEQLAKQVREKARAKATAGVIAAADEHTLEAALEAVKQQYVQAVLFGDAKRIKDLLQKLGESPDAFEIISADSPAEAARKAGIAARDGRVQFLMKGGIPTSVMLRALFDAEVKFRTGRLITHMSIVHIPTYHKLIAVTDVAITVYPTLEQKVDILNNAVDAMLAMGFDNPKVAALAASEEVSPKITETVEARELQEMNRAGRIENCIVEGPLSFDLALDPESAALKHVESGVAGDPDLLLVPNLAAGNILIKCLRVCAKARIAGLVVGGSVPIALSSRAAASADKFLPVVLAAAAAFSREG